MESELIAWLREQLPPAKDAPLGLSDDAALLPWGDRGDCLVTVDTLTDGVDFRVSIDDPRRIGRKALAANLSDMAAMAARPVAALVSLVLPRKGGLELAKNLYRGMLPLADQFGVTIAGGDTNAWDGPLVAGVTIIGQPTGRGPLKRSSARPGDVILVTGALGGSILGKQFDFRPRVEEAILLHERYELTAGMDISDGLLLDLSRMTSASGCGAMIDLDTVPIDPAAMVWAAQLDDGSSGLDHALADGEDFELLLTAHPEQADRLLADQPMDVPITAIGRIVAEAGLWAAQSGTRRPLAPRGYEHRFEP